jgi:hypothetical protein
MMQPMKTNGKLSFQYHQSDVPLQIMNQLHDKGVYARINEHNTTIFETKSGFGSMQNDIVLGFFSKKYPEKIVFINIYSDDQSKIDSNGAKQYLLFALGASMFKTDNPIPGLTHFLTDERMYEKRYTSSYPEILKMIQTNPINLKSIAEKINSLPEFRSENDFLIPPN